MNQSLSASSAEDVAVDALDWIVSAYDGNGHGDVARLRRKAYLVGAALITKAHAQLRYSLLKGGWDCDVEAHDYTALVYGQPLFGKAEFAYGRARVHHRADSYPAGSFYLKRGRHRVLAQRAVSV